MSAAPFLPKQVDYEHLKGAAKSCHGCPLYRGATQAVFGEGHIPSRLVLIGEQPGTDEDKKGGPSSARRGGS